MQADSKEPVTTSPRSRCPSGVEESSSQNNLFTHGSLKLTPLLLTADCTLPIFLVRRREYSEAVFQLLIRVVSKKAYDSVKREFLYNILIERGIPMKMVRLITMCLNETYSRVHLGKQSSIMFPVRNGLKQGFALSPLLFNFTLEYVIRRAQVNQVA